MPPPRTHNRRHLASVMTAAALAAGALIAAVVVPPQRARAAGAGDDAQAGAVAVDAGGSWCARIPPGYGHPPANLTPLAVEVTQPSVEPVPATDGLIHLAYVAQVTNTQATPADILGVVPVDPLAGFGPTGRNLITDEHGNSVAGQVQLFSNPTAPAPVGAVVAEPEPIFTPSMPAGNAGLMFFDVTYTDPARIPRLLSHAITLATPNGGPGTPALTDPVPVGCHKLAVLHPPLAGHGWLDFHGCCSIAAYHEGALPVNGTLKAVQNFGIDFVQIGPNNTCCHGPAQDLTSWWGYGAPVLAAAPGVVVQVTDGIPNNEPVGILPPFNPATALGNHVIEYIGGGQYALYAHLQPGSIPASVRAGARLDTGVVTGRLGNSGSTPEPHLHFQVMDGPEPLDATALPFVFDTQLLEGRVPEPALSDLVQGDPFTIDRTGAGVRRNLMPARNGVFGYNLSSQ